MEVFPCALVILDALTKLRKRSRLVLNQDTKY